MREKMFGRARRNRIRSHRPQVRRLHQRQCARGAAVDRRPLVRGTGLVRRRPLPRLVRHPQQPHDALRRDRRLRLGVSRSRRTIPTAIRSTARAGWSPASTWPAASPAPSIDGSITVIADRFEGKRLNSPNDAVVKSDGSIWFTDPPYGIHQRLRGHARRSRDRRLPCLPRRPGEPARSRAMTTTSSSRTASPSRPTRSSLYVADTGAPHDHDGPRHIRKFASARTAR